MLPCLIFTKILLFGNPPQLIANVPQYTASGRLPLSVLLPALEPSRASFMNYSNIDSRIRTKVVLRPKPRANKPKDNAGKSLPGDPESSRKGSEKKSSYRVDQAVDK